MKLYRLLRYFIFTDDSQTDCKGCDTRLAVWHDGSGQTGRWGDDDDDDDHANDYDNDYGDEC